MSDLQNEPLSSNIIITPSAQDYLAELLAKQEVDGIGVRIFCGTRRHTPSRMLYELLPAR